MTLFLPATTVAQDSNGVALPSSTWSFLYEGTTTPAAVIGGETSATADASGEFSTISLSGSITYRATLKDADGKVILDLSPVLDSLFAPIAKRAADGSGNVLSGATWNFYTTGTTTPQPVYADSDLTTALGASVEANAAGQFPPIYLDGNITYKAVLKDAAGVTLDTIDPVTTTTMWAYLDPNAFTYTDTINDGVFTWTLSAEQASGQYADGSYWVVIPPAGVTLSSVVTASLTASGTFAGGASYTDEVLHGMMFDPAQGSGSFGSAPHGFHSFEQGDYAGMASTLQPYSAALNKDPGIAGAQTISTPKTAVKTLTDTTPPTNGRDGIITDMQYLTFVSDAPLPNSFRPGPRNTDKASYFTTADVDTSFLPNLAAPASLPSYETLLGYIEGPFQTCYPNNLFSRNVNPSNNQEGYGRDIANDLTDVYLALCTDGLTSQQKTTLLTYVVQLGLDIINNALDGASWGPTTGSFGGGQHWVKAAAIIAAHALRNADNTVKAAQLLARVDPDQYKFTSEDRVFYYVGRTEIESFPDQRTGFDHIDFKDYMENAPLWNSKPSSPVYAGAAIEHAYRQIVWTGTIGQVLALRMMGIDEYLTPATTDYLDFMLDYHANEGSALSAPNAMTAFCEDMVDNFKATYCDNYADAAVPSLVRTVCREDYVWFEFDKLLSKSAIPAASAFTVNVNGSPVSITTQADDFTDTTNLIFEFQSPNVYGYSLAVKLDTPVAEGDTVTIAYTKPGTNAAVTLGGAEVASITATAATNETGLLPDAAASIDTVTGVGASDATTQYSGTVALPPETIDWLQLSARFQLHSLSANDTFISAASTSTTLFWMYISSGTNCRLYFGGAGTNRVDFSIASLPLDTDITMHLYIDYSQSDETDAVKPYFEWDGGSYTPTIASSARTPDSRTLSELFNSGFYVGGPTGAGFQADMSHTAYLLRFGQGSTPAAPTYSNAAFDWDADWGDNGENVWGEPDYYWAGPLSEWNGGVPNRGNRGALTLAPRLLDEETETLVTSYTVTA